MGQEGSLRERFLENLIFSIPPLVITFLIALVVFWNTNLIQEYIAAFLGYLLVLIFIWYLNKHKKTNDRPSHLGPISPSLPLHSPIPPDPTSLSPAPPNPHEKELALIVPSNTMRARKGVKQPMTAKIRNASDLQLEYVHLGVQCLSHRNLLKMLRVIHNNQRIEIYEDQMVTDQIIPKLNPTQVEPVQLAFVQPAGICPLNISAGRKSHKLNFDIFAKSDEPPKKSNSTTIEVECECEK